MNWLSQNWIWIAVAIGALFWVLQHFGMGAHGMSRLIANAGASGGSGSAAEPEADWASTYDPITRRALPAGASVSTVYHGRAYYFESRENRDAFESDPEKYLAGAPALGQPLDAQKASAAQPRRRGCC